MISKRRRQVRLVFRAANDASEEAIRNLINGGLAEMIAAYIGGKLARNRHAGTVVKECDAAKSNLKAGPMKTGSINHHPPGFAAQQMKIIGKTK